MNFVHTQRIVTPPRAALLAALVLSAPVFGATNDSEAGLTYHERVAQNAIVESPNRSSAIDIRSTTLVDNENSAQHAIAGFDATRSSTILAAKDEPVLAQNEHAAQRVIVELPRPRHVSNAVTASWVSARAAQPSSQR